MRVLPADGEVFLPDVEATEGLGSMLAGEVAGGTLILLEGPLGAGKTCVVRGLVRALGGDPVEVCSPTFTLLEGYRVCAPGIRVVHHADLYRLRGRSSAPWEEVGLGECLDDVLAVTAVEWPAGWDWRSRTDGPVIRVVLSLRGAGRSAQLYFAAASQSTV